VTDTIATNGTALQLLLSAERLVAVHGPSGVSLRQIATEAGSGNNSAIQYHFGSKEALLRAVVTHRLKELRQRRALLRSRTDPDDLHGRVEAHFLPILELAESPGNQYVSFIEQLQRSPDRRILQNQPEVRQSRSEFTADVQRLLPDLAEPARTMRIEQVQDLGLHAAAERERALQRRDNPAPFALFVDTLIDGLTGFLATLSPAPAGADRRPARSA
jgi:AcrR family transcriptional regulator